MPNRSPAPSPAPFDYAGVDRDACARAFVAWAQQEIGNRCQLVDAENARRRAAAGSEEFDCALPDHCDANQVFLEALDPFGWDFDGSDACIEFVNDVWRRARALGFWSPVNSGHGPEKFAEAAAARAARQSVPRIEIDVEGGCVWAVRSSADLPVFVCDRDFGEVDDQNDMNENGDLIFVRQLDPIPLPAAPGSPFLRRLTSRELSTILAALRHWQETTDDVDTAAEFVDGIGPDGETLDEIPLRHADIDDLCERLNCGD